MHDNNHNLAFAIEGYERDLNLLCGAPECSVWQLLLAFCDRYFTNLTATYPPAFASYHLFRFTFATTVNKEYN